MPELSDLVSAPAAASAEPADLHSLVTSGVGDRAAALAAQQAATPKADPYTGMNKFGAGVGNAFLNTFEYGPLDAVYRIAASQEKEPNGPYHQKLAALDAERADREKLFAPATNSWPGMAGNVAEKTAEQAVLAPTKLARGIGNTLWWLGEGLAQPGSWGERLASGAANAVGSMFGDVLNVATNKVINAAQHNWKPELAEAANKDVDLRAQGLQGSYAAAKPPSATMQAYQNWITNGGATNNRVLDAFRANAQRVADNRDALWAAVDTAAQRAGNPAVDASGTAGALRDFIQGHGYQPLVAAAPTRESAARMLVLADPSLADVATGMLANAWGNTAQAVSKAQKTVAGFIQEGSNLPFDKFREVQRGVGALSRNMRRSPDIPGEAVSGANAAYGRTFDDLDSIFNNANTLRKVATGSDLLNSLEQARNYHRDVALPWETGYARTPAGKDVPLPILHALATGKYDVAPNRIITDVLAARNNPMLANYYGSTLDSEAQRAINGLQADPARAKAWAAMQDLDPSQAPSSNTGVGLVRRGIQSVQDRLDRSPTYKDFMFASPSVVPSRSPFSLYRNAEDTAKALLSTGIKGTAVATGRQTGLGALALTREAPQLAREAPVVGPALRVLGFTGGSDHAPGEHNMGISQHYGESP